MFFARRPSAGAIDRFLRASEDLPLSYAPVGIVRDASAGFRVDDDTFVVGRGAQDFERARAALMAWKHFNIGWVEVFPQQAPVAVGTVVAVLIRHLRFWSLNGCRVVYSVGARGDARFGFAYGTLPNHAEAGEELFEVFHDAESGDVGYRIRAASRPRAALAFMGAPIVRVLQARFRQDSAAATKRATRASGFGP